MQGSGPGYVATGKHLTSKMNVVPRKIREIKSYITQQTEGMENTSDHFLKCLYVFHGFTHIKAPSSYIRTISQTPN